MIMLKNGTFIDEETFRKLGKLYEHKFTDYKTCKAFVREKGNALYNPDHELCYIISVEKDGIYGYSINIVVDRDVDCDVREWADKDQENEDFFCHFHSLDYTDFSYWDFEKEGEI